MRATIRSFTPLFLLALLLLVLGTSGCPAWLDDNGPQDGIRDLTGDSDADEPNGDSDEDDLPGGPSDDDDSVDVDEEPDGAPCFGREQTDEDFDCDGVPDVGDIPEEDDVFFYDPNSPRFIWRDSIVVDKEANLHQVGLGYGDKTVLNGWEYVNGQAVLVVGRFIIVEVAPGIYRVNLLDEEGNWGQFGDYCEDGVWLDNGDWIRDPACMYDAGCEADDIPPGWAMTGRATESYTRRLTQSEWDDVPLAEENCPELAPQ